MKKVNSVEEYISQAPKPVQLKLRELRKLIISLAPEAEEKISYGMPYYGSKGNKGRLVYFAAQKEYIGLYIPPPIIDQHPNELKKYTTTKSAIHFPNDQDLPFALIKKLVKARIKWNEKSAKS